MIILATIPSYITMSHRYLRLNRWLWVWLGARVLSCIQRINYLLIHVVFGLHCFCNDVWLSNTEATLTLISYYKGEVPTS